ncbi:hypothetical protein, partial [Flexivirga caeni]
MDDDVAVIFGDTAPRWDDAAVASVHRMLTDALVGETDGLAQIRVLEELKGAICARQAKVTVAVHERQRAADAARGLDRG